MTQIKEKETKTKEPTTETSAVDVARYMLSLDPERKYFTKKYGNFRLNALLHIEQILHYAKFRTPLFKEDMLAYPSDWHKLSKKNLKRLNEIMTQPQTVNKHLLVGELYENDKNAKLSEWELELVQKVKEENNK